MTGPRRDKNLVKLQEVEQKSAVPAFALIIQISVIRVDQW
jgi:hypothetical protein